MAQIAPSPADLVAKHNRDPNQTTYTPHYDLFKHAAAIGARPEVLNRVIEGFLSGRKSKFRNRLKLEFQLLAKLIDVDDLNDPQRASAMHKLLLGLGILSPYVRSKLHQAELDHQQNIDFRKQAEQHRKLLTLAKDLFKAPQDRLLDRMMADMAAKYNQLKLDLRAKKAPKDVLDNFYQDGGHCKHAYQRRENAISSKASQGIFDDLKAAGIMAAELEYSYYSYFLELVGLDGKLDAAEDLQKAYYDFSKKKYGGMQGAAPMAPAGMGPVARAPGMGG